MMSKSQLIILSLMLCSSAWAQTPPSCFEIESILVDACALGQNCDDASDPACNCEGKNEMFRFVVGADDLSTADMTIDWPNGFNDWQGVCQNATTAQHVADLNATIQNCGYIVEHENGVLPAGSDVLVVTSTDMCVASNSFAGLADTLIIVFQCPGNYFGHFANQSNGSNNLRTLEMNFGQDCEDEVTYDRSLLVDQFGTNTPQDGATVDFTWNGAASYYNNGCNAPVEQAIFDAGADATLCPGESIALNAQVDGQYTDILWTGGNGEFADPSNTATTYTPSPDDPAEFTLTLIAQGCNGLISDEIQVQNLNQALTGITADGPTAICDGQELTLTAQGNGLFQWSTGVVAPSITVSEPDTYSVTVNNSCGTFSESIEIESIASPQVDVLNDLEETFCQGGSILLQATGSGGEITWSTNETGASITVDEEGWYYASVENQCATVSDSSQLILIPEATVTIEPSGPISLCEGEEFILTAEGEGIFTWSSGEQGETITVDDSGSYSVQAENACGTDTDGVEVLYGGSAPVASIEASDVMLCPGETIQLSGSGGETYAWNGVASGPELQVDAPGEYTLTAINDCGEDETSQIISWDEIPAATLVDGPDFAICNGQEAIVQVTGNGTFTWSDGAVADTQVFTQTGNYYVVAEAACGTDTAFFHIVTEEITAQAFADPIAGEAPLTVDFIDETANSLTSEWVFEQGQLSNSSQTSYTFLDEATYEVVLTVHSALGCESRTTVNIEVGACPFSLFVPSAFTPDGDGVNDQLRTVGNCIDRFEWTVYDRWGRQVFYTTDPDARWTGADRSGYAVSDGEYPYWIQVMDSNGVTHRVEGSIVVIR
ncbi:MAG: hypothetical protein HKN79_01855 [Flavobacteriales bacterium]|nr:hypothetical protein [Flavobacteriales bacterium]